MSRSKNGMGSVRRRADGRWEGRYSDPNGRQRSVYGKTQKECTQKLKEALRAVDTGSWLEPATLTVAGWLDQWLADYQGHTSGRTRETYLWVVEKRLKPALGKIRLQSLSKAHVNHFVTDLQRHPYSPATIRHAVMILRRAIQCAIDGGLLASNPVDAVKTPRPEPPKYRIVDRALMPAFVAEAQKSKFGDAILFMVMTGLRAGELRGLRWSDVDFEAHEMHIERQLHAPSAKSREFRPPKDQSRRVIRLPAGAVALLKQHRKSQLQQRVAAGSEWREDEITADLIFRLPDGRNYDESGLYLAVKAVGAAIGIDGLHPHDLRHSYAVAALRSGADVKTVQHNLGHKSAAMTLDVYAAYTSDAGQVAAQRFDDYWHGAVGSTSPDN